MRFIIAYFAVVASMITLSGCETAPEETSVPVASAPTTGPTPAPQAMLNVTYRVTGAARGIVGAYTDATGAEIAIPASVAAAGDAPAHASLPWEISAQIPIELAKKQLLVLTARDAFGTDIAITAEILVDGKVVTSATGPEPRLSIQKH